MALGMALGMALAMGLDKVVEVGMAHLGMGLDLCVFARLCSHLGLDLSCHIDRVLFISYYF
jgi:hypothetical protein